jgi:predicted ABC-type sugar transport system permease subunit
MMAFLRFWKDFLIGDDLTLAVGVVAGIAAVAILHAAGAPAWWALPVAVAATMALSLRRAIRRPKG